MDRISQNHYYIVIIVSLMFDAAFGTAKRTMAKYSIMEIDAEKP